MHIVYKVRGIFYQRVINIGICLCPVHLLHPRLQIAHSVLPHIAFLAVKLQRFEQVSRLVAQGFRHMLAVIGLGEPAIERLSVLLYARLVLGNVPLVAQLLILGLSLFPLLLHERVVPRPLHFKLFLLLVGKSLALRQCHILAV